MIDTETRKAIVLYIEAAESLGTQKEASALLRQCLEENAALESKLKACVEALEPFAELYMTWEPHEGTSMAYQVDADWLARAKAALENK